MPVLRYFLFVGAALLAVLFGLDAFSPQQAAVASNSAPSIDKTVVRIRSDQKLPERVVYDMNLPTIVPAAPKTQVGAVQAPALPEFTATARVRETFAQFVPAEAKKADVKAERPVQRKRKVLAKAKIRPTQPPMRFAQQQHPSFFGGNTWTNTW